MSASEIPFDDISTSNIELRRVLAKIALRKIEALKLYRPMPFQQAFHESMAVERIIRGSNRSGKTVAAAVEVAKAVTGQDESNRYPKEDGVCYCVAQDNDELAQVMWKLLCSPGAIRMIRDVKTNEWRSFDPTNPQDTDREREAKPALPFIPKRFIESISWESKKESIPRTLILTNGWKVHFYSSNSKPPHGTAIDLAFFDEEIIDREWYSEIAARLIDKGGRFIWSATPQTGTERLYSLHERADAQGGVWVAGRWIGEDKRKDKTRQRTIEEFFCTIDDNKHLTTARREVIKEKFAEDEESYRVRIGGEFAILSGSVYPEYSSRVHEVFPREIPPNWTRYVAIDPGRQVCAALFMAIPPPEEDEHAYLYDELYLRNATAATFGRAMAEKQGKQTFQAFIIDMRGARHHDMGSGLKVVEQYSEQLKINKVSSVETGYEFIPGNDNEAAGIGAVHLWLAMRQDGTGKLQVFSTLENFRREMRHYRNKKIKGADGRTVFVDKPESKNDHLCDCVRYLCQYNPSWVMPKTVKSEVGGAIRWYRNRQKEKQKEGRMGNSMLLGPRERS